MWSEKDSIQGNGHSQANNKRFILSEALTTTHTHVTGVK